MNRRLGIGLAALLMAGWFVASGSAVGADEPAASQGVPEAGEPPRIALIATYFAARSHGNSLGSHYFIGFPLDGELIEPQVEVASMFIEQDAPDEIDYDTRGHWDAGRRLAERHGATVYPTIADALTLGGDELAVDGVLYIGEHGDYARNRFGSKMYPRMNHLEQIFRVFDASDRSVPVFNDKHLSYSWLDSKWIYDRAQELEVPMMAGSSLPVAWREPPLEHALEAPIEEAVAIGYGAFDSYGFHTLEILQSMIERREGGETGVASVRTLTGEAVYDAADAGAFSWALVEAALDAAADKRAETEAVREAVSDPIAILIEYRDGTRGTVLLLGRYMNQSWTYAAEVGGETVSSEFVLHSRTTEGEPVPISAQAHFGALNVNIERMFLTGEPQTPVERTLLTSGVLDMAFRSRARDGEVIETPFLDIEYSAEGYDPVRVGAPKPERQSVETWPPAGYEFLLWRRTLYEAGRPADSAAE